MPDKEIFDPDTFEALRCRLLALEERSTRHAQEAQAISREITDLAAAMVLKAATTSWGSVKRDSGRLSDEGIRNMHAAFANNMRVGEAARTFGISQSAASARYKEWRASQRSAPPVYPAPAPAPPTSAVHPAPGAEPEPAASAIPPAPEPKTEPPAPPAPASAPEPEPPADAAAVTPTPELEPSIPPVSAPEPEPEPPVAPKPKRRSRRKAKPTEDG